MFFRIWIDFLSFRTSWSERVRCRGGWGWMENLRFLFHFLRLTLLHYIYPNPRFFSQKLTSWVFNDQPCECADVGQSRTIGRAAKIGWEKKLSRKWYPRFLSVKSLIGRFYWEETGDRRVIADPAARIRFYLHKDFRAAEIRVYLHKDFRAAESWFYLHKEFRVAGIELYLHKEFLKKIHE